MGDTSFLDSINAERRKRKARRKYYVITSIVFVLLMIGLGSVFIHQKKHTPSTSINLVTNTATPQYQYAYLGQECSTGLQKYTSLINQINAETNNIGSLIKEPSWSSNDANLVAAANVLTTNESVLQEASDRVQRLESCISSVQSNYDFTQAQIQDINTITSEIPTASTQPTTVADTTLPTYTVTPYTYQYTPVTYDNTTSNPTSTTTNSSSTSTAPAVGTNTSVSPTTAQPVTCNTTLKAEYTTQYQEESSNLGSEENAAITQEEAIIGSEGLSTSGVGQAKIYEIQTEYDQQQQQLQQSYNSELAAINC